MQHEQWCDRAFHQVPPEEPAAEVPGHCVSDLGAQVDHAAAYLRGSDEGPEVVFMGPNGAALPVQRAAEYGQQIIDLAVRGGATRPEPGPA